MTTATAENFLADILAHPEDDTPRLIFADFLEEHGQEQRAEFIRVQCRIAALTAEIASDEDCGNPGCTACADRRVLQSSEKALLTPGHFWDWFASSAGGWLRAWPGTPAVQIKGGECEVGYFSDPRGLPPRWTFTVRRGFVDAVALPAAAWREWGAFIQREQPLREVRITGEYLPGFTVLNTGKAPLTVRSEALGFGDALMVVVQPGGAFAYAGQAPPADTIADVLPGDPPAALPLWFRQALGLTPGGTTVIHPGSNRFGIDNPLAARYRRIQGVPDPTGHGLMMPCNCGQGALAFWQHEPSNPIEPTTFQEVMMYRHRYRRHEGDVVQESACFVGQCSRCHLVYWTDLIPLPVPLGL